MRINHRTIIIVYIVALLVLTLLISVALFSFLNNPEAVGRFFGRIERGYEQTESQ